MFDKTGTLTLGVPRVTAMVLAQQNIPGVKPEKATGKWENDAADYGQDTLLRFAASVDKQIIMLTGDSEVMARQIGDLARIDRVISRCLPEDKVRIVQELTQQGHRVLMVGDGINDAPTLATATVGMALGTQGLTADTVLLSTDILRVARGVRLGHRVMRVALQGIWVGMGLSVIAMSFAAAGCIIPAVGAILQEAIDVIVILNALRAGRVTFQNI